MDRRLNEYLDSKYNDGNTLFIRNAGANLTPILDLVREALRKNELKKGIYIATHNDCGAMGVVFQALTSGKSFGSGIYNALIKQFESIGFRSREGLERENGRLQVKRAKAIAKGVPVNLEPIDVKRLGVPAEHNEHRLILTSNLSEPYVKMTKIANTGVFDSYIIQGDTAFMSSDVEIAVKFLGIKDVRLEAFSTSEEARLSAELESLGREPFMHDAKCSLIRALR